VKPGGAVTLSVHVTPPAVGVRLVPVTVESDATSGRELQLLVESRSDSRPPYVSRVDGNLIVREVEHGPVRREITVETIEPTGNQVAPTISGAPAGVRLLPSVVTDHAAAVPEGFLGRVYVFPVEIDEPHMGAVIDGVLQVGEPWGLKRSFSIIVQREAIRPLRVFPSRIVVSRPGGVGATSAKKVLIVTTAPADRLDVHIDTKGPARYTVEDLRRGEQPNTWSLRVVASSSAGELEPTPAELVVSLPGPNGTTSRVPILEETPP
jgi:hypothetical protein